MSTVNDLATLAAMIGDPARAAMLMTLMDGRALTAGELAAAAGVTPQTASGHLSKLVEAGLLAVARQGRHRYHRLASRAVATMLEGMQSVIDAPATRPPRTGPRDTAMREARICYDHLAGRLGVAMTDALVAAGHVEIDGEGGLVTASGGAFLARLGVDFPPGGGERRLCRPCLDWSERRPHLGGALGAALCAHCLDRGWVRRREGGRALLVTPAGRAELERGFGVAF